jgi:hypothetical protein
MPAPTDTEARFCKSREVLNQRTSYAKQKVAAIRAKRARRKAEEAKQRAAAEEAARPKRDRLSELKAAAQRRKAEAA